MGYVDSSNLRSSELVPNRRVIFVIVISVALLIATLGISASHMAVNKISPETKPTFNMQSYAHEEWYPLIKDYQIKLNVITLYTLIYPDEEGKKLAQQIANDISQNDPLHEGVNVYGLNITPYFLAASNN